MKKIIMSCVVSLALVACSGTQPSAPPEPDLPPPPVAELERPSFYASQMQAVTAVVEAIDHETREVTLRRDDGVIINITASEDVRNLHQVTVGDVLHAQYEESISIEVVANEGFEPDEAEAAALARAEEGGMPGVAAMDTVVVMATVEEINVEANTFKLKGPDGTINEYVARNPENLTRAKVGDLVVITTTTALALSVEHPAEAE